MTSGHDSKQAAPEELAALAWPCFADRLPAREAASEPMKEWFGKLLAVFLPTVDRLDELPAKCAFLFGFDAEAARLEPENAGALNADSARVVLAEFADRARTDAAPVTWEVFNSWMEEIEAAAGVTTSEFSGPVRIALTGACSGPDFDNLLPLIEDGAALGIGIPCVRDRVERFVGV